MNIRKRLEALERQFAGGGDVVLTMCDGTVKTIALEPREDVLDLFSRVLQNPDSAEAIFIRESVSAVEPGGGRLMELCRAGLLGPIEEQGVQHDRPAHNNR